MKMNPLFLAVLLLAAVPAALAADAKENWAKHCAKCHGATGAGDTKMGKKLRVKDYTDAGVQAAMKEGEMVKAIKEGKKEGNVTQMKAYTELSDAEIKALVALVRTFKK